MRPPSEPPSLLEVLARPPNAAPSEVCGDQCARLPEGAAAYARTATYSARSIPANLRKAHRTKAGTWAKIVILEL